MKFTVDAFPNRNFEGVVQQIRLNPTTQQNVVTYNVRITVANPDHILLPGMTVYVSIGVQQRDDVLLVPNRRCAQPPELPESLRKWAKPASTAGNGNPAAAAGAGKGKKRDGQNATVYVLNGQELQPVSVQLGITDNRNTEVLGGELAEGARIVVGENSLAGSKPSSGRHADVLMTVAMNAANNEPVIRVVGLGNFTPPPPGCFRPCAGST